MATKTSAGLLLFRTPDRSGALSTEVLIGHMGGPFWQDQEERAWSAPKGEYTPDEEPMAAARREFEEELGFAPPEGEWLPLGESRQHHGKIVTLWAMEADLDPAPFVPGNFTMEWPPRSGRLMEFPEIDRVEWTGVEAARTRLVPGQLVFLDRLEELLVSRRG